MTTPVCALFILHVQDWVSAGMLVYSAKDGSGVGSLCAIKQPPFTAMSFPSQLTVTLMMPISLVRVVTNWSFK